MNCKHCNKPTDGEVIHLICIRYLVAKHKNPYADRYYFE